MFCTIIPKFGLVRAVILSVPVFSNVLHSKQPNR